jgi:hypothetical protein
VALGFFVAPLVPAALWALAGVWRGLSWAGYGHSVILMALYGAYPAAVLLGLPAYFIFRQRMRPRLISVVLAGGLIAAAPWPVVELLVSNPDQAWVGECQTVLDGKTTWCGYLEGMKFLALVFGLGAIGGLAFWICVIWRDPRLAGLSRDSAGI